MLSVPTETDMTDLEVLAEKDWEEGDSLDAFFTRSFETYCCGREAVVCCLIVKRGLYWWKPPTAKNDERGQDFVELCPSASQDETPTRPF